MKIILSLLVLLSSTYAMAEDELRFQPSYAAGIGYHIGPLTEEESAGYVVVKSYLFRDTQLEAANLGGIGLSLNTKGQVHAIISPMSFYINNLHFSPELGIGIGEAKNKLGFSVSMGF